jgi:hypothetical protein
MDDLFDDIPDDLASLPIDDLLFSDYLDSMSAHLLEPSSDSADAGFSGSHSENQQIDGLCEPLATSFSVRYQDHSEQVLKPANTVSYLFQPCKDCFKL